MRPIQRLVVLGTVVGAGLMSSAAQAVPLSFLGAGNGAGGSATWSTIHEGVTVTISANPNNEVLWWDETDGFGVDDLGDNPLGDLSPGNENDEVEFPE